MAARSSVDFDKLSASELKKLLNARQERFVALLVDGCGQTEAAVKAGYSSKTAASQASDLLKIPKVAAYRRALTRVVLDRLCLTPESIALRLFEVYERCMSARPVLTWDSDVRAWVERGVFQFDAKGATRVLELLGKNAGMFADKVQVSGHVDGLEGYLRGMGDKAG